MASSSSNSSATADSSAAPTPAANVGFGTFTGGPLDDSYFPALVGRPESRRSSTAVAAKSPLLSDMPARGMRLGPLGATQLSSPKQAVSGSLLELTGSSPETFRSDAPRSSTAASFALPLACPVTLTQESPRAAGKRKLDSQAGASDPFGYFRNMPVSNKLPPGLAHIQAVTVTRDPVPRALLLSMKPRPSGSIFSTYLLGGEVITTELLIQMASHLSSRLLDLSKFAAPDVDLETEEWVGRLMRHVARREEAVGISSSEGRYKKGIYGSGAHGTLAKADWIAVQRHLYRPYWDLQAGIERQYGGNPASWIYASVALDALVCLRAYQMEPVGFHAYNSFFALVVEIDDPNVGPMRDLIFARAGLADGLNAANVVGTGKRVSRRPAKPRE